ncbi:hypothetical protein BY996DRAFT_3309753 [Phakopsora pachyrhizi]|uniref:Expressed protein n=1 Tax=Phakopsora pachyrhizi TaxID=170000 RepID=A0AAV0AME8_PHAPC|nr:hypothetical protein BY996DRAFT_3309753 [Phakopsora pachyrhizi]CAH7669943.1 expressed protein [Phakopsora pachyrhizi]
MRLCSTHTPPTQNLVFSSSLQAGCCAQVIPLSAGRRTPVPSPFAGRCAQVPSSFTGCHAQALHHRLQAVVLKFYYRLRAVMPKLHHRLQAVVPKFNHHLRVFVPKHPHHSSFAGRYALPQYCLNIHYIVLVQYFPHMCGPTNYQLLVLWGGVKEDTDGGKTSAGYSGVPVSVLCFFPHTVLSKYDPFFKNLKFGGKKKRLYYPPCHCRQYAV